MAPKPEEPKIASEGQIAPEMDEESIVISGISGAYPSCEDVKGLSEILYNKVNPITVYKPRWKYQHPELPTYTGIIPNLQRYDAQFFKVHFRQASSQDVMSKKILEHTYQAIFDAGVSAEQLSGKCVGVYIAQTFAEFEKQVAYDNAEATGFGIAGCNKAMTANRVSYWLNVRGPSMTIDADACGSIVALDQAIKDIKAGECEAAIVGSANVCLHPQSSIHAGRVYTLNNDGKTKSFSKDCDGVTRAEAINVMFIQKAKNALRIYCNVLHAKCEFLPKSNEEKIGFIRDPNQVAEFIEHFYAEAKVSPKAVEYVEALGSAMPDSDKTELETLEKVYCKDRHDPLLVGSVTSNIGYSDAAVGISAITKVCLGFENGILAANLHCSEPRSDVNALQDGRMRIVTEHQPFGRSYVAVNSMSYTGNNAHVLLHGQFKPKDPNRYKSNIPRLVTISGRLEAAVENIINDLKLRPIDPEELALLHNVYEHSQPGHLSRGYIILDNDVHLNTKVVAENVSYYDISNRPLWFVYSGMGSQWAGMGTHLMRIPVFAAAIEKCHKVLAPKGIDIVHIITSTDKKIFDNILHSFVGIAAIQIGLTDILTEIGIVPDKIIGHSVGELGCGYADGCLSAEEMILAAYSRGLVSLQTPLIRGSMAAVGIGYQQVSKLCPPEIEVACHNGPESATISGPADAMRQFVAELTAKGIFAKEVPCSNIAYHSRYIADAGPKLFEYLSKVIVNPKKRSDRWLSTSVPQEKWGEEQAQYCSAWYHTNNLLSSVLFEETSRLVPSNAVLVEIAPHGLLQAILKRSLSPDCHHIPLTKRGHADNAVFLLDAIGKLFVVGFNPKVKALYPKIEFPVSTGTPMLSHLVKWSHSEVWKLPLIPAADRKSAAVCNYMISVHDDEHAYLKGNVVRGQTEYPYAAALVAVWDTLAMYQSAKKKQLSVEFKNVHLHSQPVLFDNKHLQLSVTLHMGTGRFEVMNGLSKVANGYICCDFNEQKAIENSQEENEYMDIDSNYIYDYLHERSYSYSGDFCSVHRANLSFTKAELIWNNNWVTFIDGLLQLNILHHSHNFVAQPSHIDKIVINLKNHTEDQFNLSDDKLIISAALSSVYGITKCGGVQISKIKFYDFPPLVNETLRLQSLKFIPYFQSDCNNLTEIFKTYLQIVAENKTKDVIKVVEIANNASTNIDIITILKDTPNCTMQYDQIERDALLKARHTLDVDAILVTNLSLDKKTFEGLKRVLKPGTFIINGEQIGEKNCLSSEWYRVVSSGNVGKSLLELGRWNPLKKQSFTSSVIIRTENDLTKLSSEREKLSSNGKLLVLTPHPTLDGLKDLIKTWRKDSSRNQIFLASISGNENLERLPWSSFDFELAFNVLKNGFWGGEYFVETNENVAVEGGISLRSSTIGDLDSLHWVETAKPANHGIMVTVRYAGINDFDVKKATGIIPFYQGDPEEHLYGMDYSGTTESGERVMGIVRSGAASGRVRAVNHLLWPVPAHWTLEDAATVPLAYSQAFYCLGIKASLYPGMRLLVHGGVGALGQAVISIALANQCEVFATVSSERKKHFLKKLYPKLEDDHIGNSRDDSFGDLVLQLTKGKGCDIIISCVKGGLKNTTLKCASYCGITFDMVQAYSEDTYSYGMYYMTKQRSFVVVDFDTVFDYEEDMKDIQAIMSEGIARGYVRPLSRMTYAAQEAARAFRLQAASKHRGRTLLRLRDGIVPARPRIVCTATTSHLVFCDSEGSGLHLAGRLVKRGVKKLRLIFTSALPNNLHHKIWDWEKQGVNIEVSMESIDAVCAATAIKDTIRIAPIEGVYIVLSGSASAKYKDILSNLDSATRKLSSLKYFVVLATNTTLGQNVCMKRSNEGLPATFLNLPVTREASSWASWQHILGVVECGLHSSNPVLLVQSTTTSNPSLLEQMALVADVSVSNNNIQDETELQQLGVDGSKAHLISAFLRNSYNISLEPENIPFLTIKKIKEIEEQFTESEFKHVDGLQVFLTYIEPNELTASQRIVFLPTLVKNTKTRDEEIDVNQTYLMILPGMEAHHERFRSLCERLKVPAVVLQPGVHLLGDSLQQTAKLYVDDLRKKIPVRDNFYLLGYESGVKLALEVAAILEQDGFTGTVYCVGGVPEEIEAVMKNKLRDYDTDEALQNALVRHMLELMVNHVPEGLDAALKSAISWEAKLQATVNYTRGLVTYSKQYTQLLIETSFARLKQLREDKVQPRALRSRLVVLRAADCPAVDDIQVQRYSQQPVAAYSLRAPIAQAAKDPRCAAIVNRHLSSEILETFQNLNICDTYLKNAELLFSMALTTDDKNEE